MSEKCIFCGAEVRSLEILHTDLCEGQKISVHAEVSKCIECGEEFFTDDQTRGAINKVIIKYKSENGLFTGSELIGIRKRLQLTQEKFEKKFGFGKNTIYRWEKDLMVQKPYIDLFYRKIFDMALRGEIINRDYSIDINGEKILGASKPYKFAKGNCA